VRVYLTNGTYKSFKVLPQQCGDDLLQMCFVKLAVPKNEHISYGLYAVEGKNVEEIGANKLPFDIHKKWGLKAGDVNRFVFKLKSAKVKPVKPSSVKSPRTKDSKKSFKRNFSRGLKKRKESFMSKSSSSPGRNTVATGGSTSPKSPKFGRQAAPSTVSITSKSAKVAAKPTSKDDVDLMAEGKMKKDNIIISTKDPLQDVIMFCKKNALHEPGLFTNWGDPAKVEAAMSDYAAGKKPWLMDWSPPVAAGVLKAHLTSSELIPSTIVEKLSGLGSLKDNMYEAWEAFQNLSPQQGKRLKEFLEFLDLLDVLSFSNGMTKEKSAEVFGPMLKLSKECFSAVIVERTTIFSPDPPKKPEPAGIIEEKEPSSVVPALGVVEKSEADNDLEMMISNFSSTNLASETDSVSMDKQRRISNASIPNDNIPSPSYSSPAVASFDFNEESSSPSIGISARQEAPKESAPVTSYGDYNFDTDDIIDSFVSEGDPIAADTEFNYDDFTADIDMGADGEDEDKFDDILAMLAQQQDDLSNILN